MADGDHGTIDKLWTSIGWSLLAIFLPFIFYIRGGDNIFGKDSAPESLQITMAGWGVLVFSVGLICLAILGLKHIRNLGSEPCKTPWPANTKHENSDRDIHISRFFLALFVGTPIIAIIAGLIRYCDSQVSLWNASTPLASSFIGSRSIAYGIGCKKLPCYRIHHTQGHEYILYLTDGVLLFVVTLCLVLCIKWLYNVTAKCKQLVVEKKQNRS